MIILDGRSLSQKIKEELKLKVSKLKNKPGLAVILIGHDPASEVYVNSKEKACREIGFHSEKVLLASQVSEQEVIKKIQKLNSDPQIHAILIQSPIPKHLSFPRLIATLSPEKDVDSFHPYNLGNLTSLAEADNFDEILAPCTPKGVLKLLRHYQLPLAGKKVVILGRSILVGKPLGLMFLAANATVTLCHSHTEDLKNETQKADILVSGIGKPHFVTQDMVSQNTVVIDVGISRVDGKIVGDVDFENVKAKASFLTPVPGGVGPMTIACLMENTYLLWKRLQKNS